MTIVETKKFFCDELQYETRVMSDDSTYIIQVFAQNKKATPYTYSVDFHASQNEILGKDLYDHLLEIAETDTCAKRWIKR